MITQDANSRTQSQLAFTDPQPNPYTLSTYVFSGDSANYDGDPSNPADLGNVSTSVTPFDTYTGGDSTNDGQTRPVPLTAIGNKLLLNLQVTTNTALPPVNGDAFKISLQATDPNTGDPATYFTSNGQFIPYFVSLNSGNVRVIPEPASMVIVAPGMAVVLAFARRRRR